MRINARSRRSAVQPHRAHRLRAERRISSTTTGTSRSCRSSRRWRVSSGVRGSTSTPLRPRRPPGICVRSKFSKRRSRLERSHGIRRGRAVREGRRPVRRCRERSRRRRPSSGTRYRSSCRKYASIDSRDVRLRDGWTASGHTAVPMGESAERVDALRRRRMPGCDAVSVYLIGHDGLLRPRGDIRRPRDRARLSGRGRALRALQPRRPRGGRGARARARRAPPERSPHGSGRRLSARALRGRPRDSAGAGVVFSIHNLGYLGQFDTALLPALGLPRGPAASRESVRVHGTGEHAQARHRVRRLRQHGQ